MKRVVLFSLACLALLLCSPRSRSLGVTFDVSEPTGLAKVHIETDEERFTRVRQAIRFNLAHVRARVDRLSKTIGEPP